MNVQNSIVDLFQGNPFENKVGSCIEKATDSKNETENWALIMEACDIINSMENGPKFAIRAFKRLLAAEITKNKTTVLYTLTLLETCVKNCGYRFHLEVCSRNFLQELEKIVLNSTPTKVAKSEIPTVIRDRILLLIQTWFDSFRGQSDMREIETTYMYLKQRGVEFPMIDLVTMSPIKTPQRSVKSSISSPVEASKIQSAPVASAKSDKLVTQISENAIDKLTKNLLTVQANIDVMSDLMHEYPPVGDVADDVICLMKNLESCCQEMQVRLVELINKWQEIDQKEVSVLFDLLRVNDELHNVLVQYERYERTRLNQSDKCVPEVELNNRMTKSSLSDIYAAQQEAIDFYEGLSQLKSKADTLPDASFSLNDTERFLSRDHKLASTSIPSSSAMTTPENTRNSNRTNNDQSCLNIARDSKNALGSKPSDKKELFDL